MFKNNLNTIFRNLLRNKLFSLFNVIGLSIGIACTILIALYIYDDVGYDQFNQKANQIYRIVMETDQSGSSRFYEYSPAPLKNALKEEIPEIKNSVRFSGLQEYTSLWYKNKEYRNPNILLTDPEVFDLLDLNISKGNRKTLLTDLHTIVVTKSFAKKMFGNEDPIGKVVFMKGDFNTDFAVTGVIDDVPFKSSIRFNCLCPFELLKENRWEISNFPTYLLLKEKVRPENLQSKFSHIENKYLNSKEKKIRIHLQPLTKVHLDLNPFNNLPTTKDNKPVFLFSFIGVIILCISCFNYIILSTTNASKRNIDVGIRKTLGAKRHQVMSHYLAESILLTTLATLLGVSLVEIYLPTFNQLSEKAISIHYNNLLVYAHLGALTLFVGVSAGLYPAIFLSAFKPIGILKRDFYSTLSYKNNVFRQSLITIQLIVSILLIISTIIIQQQIAFIRNKDIGFDYKNTVVVSIHQKEVQEKYKLFTEYLLKNPTITGTSATSYIPGGLSFCQSSWWEGLPPNDKSNMLDWMSIDTAFLKILKIKLLNGKNFTTESLRQTQYLINRTALEKFEWKDGLGKSVDVIGKGEVIGIVEDFNFKSLHNPVKPIALCIYPDIYEYLYIKFQSEHTSKAIQIIQNEWNRLFSNIELNYMFLDECLEKTYSKEIKTSSIINSFAIIAIILSCLGIYSLVSFSTQQRTKEIGIRKVNGATTTQIMVLLLYDFIKSIAIAFVVASPVAYYTMNKWLTNFAYRTNLSWWIFAFAGILTLVSAIVTISWQAWRAASRNPVDALRYE